MLQETELRAAVYGWIEALAPGTIFFTNDMYRFLEEHFPHECQKRGDLPTEPRYKNDARWVVRDAKDKRIVERTNERGKYRTI